MNQSWTFIYCISAVSKRPFFVYGRRKADGVWLLLWPGRCGAISVLPDTEALDHQWSVQGCFGRSEAVVRPDAGSTLSVDKELMVRCDEPGIHHLYDWGRNGGYALQESESLQAGIRVGKECRADQEEASGAGKTVFDLCSEVFHNLPTESFGIKN